MRGENTGFAATFIPYLMLLHALRVRNASIEGVRVKLFRFGGLAMKTVRTERLEIAFEDGGPSEGDPVLLLHGWRDAPRGWNLVASGLHQFLQPRLGSSHVELLSIALDAWGGIGATIRRTAETAQSGSGIVGTCPDDSRWR